MTYRRVSRLSSPLTAKAFTKRPSRAWFDPEIERLASITTPQLVTKKGLHSEPKVIHFFPLFIRDPHFRWSSDPRGEWRTLNNLAIARVTLPCRSARWLVYLTWTTLFISVGRHIRGRGNNHCTCSPSHHLHPCGLLCNTKAPNWDHPLT